MTVLNNLNLKQMNLEKIAIGNNPPEDINVIIEIPMNSAEPIKYEFDKEARMLVVDRISNTPMFYPCNYGFTPNTLSDDGDPLDVLVVSRYPFLSGSMINTRPIGVLIMEDESGKDEKIIAVPNHKITDYYDNVKDISDLPVSLINEIKFFFETYKNLYSNKWTKVDSVRGANEAKEYILSSIKNVEKK